jgi:ferredoxin
MEVITVKVQANRDVCIGAGLCLLAAPDVFDQSDDDGLVVLLDKHPEDAPSVREAVANCPSGAISIVE